MFSGTLAARNAVTTRFRSWSAAISAFQISSVGSGNTDLGLGSGVAIITDIGLVSLHNGSGPDGSFTSASAF